MNNIIESFVFYHTPIKLRFSEYTKMHEKGMSVKNASSQYDKETIYGTFYDPCGFFTSFQIY